MTYFFPHQPCPSNLYCYLSSSNYAYLNIFTFQENLLCILFLLGDWSLGFPPLSDRYSKADGIRILPPPAPPPTSYISIISRPGLPVKVVLFPFWQLSAEPAILPGCLKGNLKAQWPRNTGIGQWMWNDLCKGTVKGVVQVASSVQTSGGFDAKGNCAIIHSSIYSAYKYVNVQLALQDTVPILEIS